MQKLTFEPERWLDVAEFCCRPHAPAYREAMLRTALNRAYYAVLLSIKQRIEAVRGPGSVPSRRTHEAIHRALASGGRAFRVSLYLLRELRRKREAADYDLASIAPTLTDARDAVRESRRVIRSKIKPLPDADVRTLTLR